MTIPRQRCTINFVCAPVRSGKTHLINEWCEGENRIVRFDITGELVDVPGWTHIYASPLQAYKLMMANPYFFRIAYHPSADIVAEFNHISRAMWRLPIDKVLVCDEIHEVCGVNDAGLWMKTILRYARHAKLELICASQRIPDVNKLLTSGADTVVLFHTTDERDLMAIENRWPKARPIVERLRPLRYNDLTKVTSQVPQACVISRSQGTVKIYDFETQGFITKRDASIEERPDIIEEITTEEYEDEDEDNFRAGS